MLVSLLAGAVAVPDGARDEATGLIATAGKGLATRDYTQHTTVAALVLQKCYSDPVFLKLIPCNRHQS